MFPFQIVIFFLPITDLNSISLIFHKFLDSDLTSYLRLKYLPIATPCDHPWIMSLHWRPNNLLLIRWCISQLQHFVASASNFLIGHLLPIVLFHFFETSAPARVGHCLVLYNPCLSLLYVLALPRVLPGVLHETATAGATACCAGTPRGKWIARMIEDQIWFHASDQ